MRLTDSHDRGIRSTAASALLGEESNLSLSTGT